jgi:MFS family permease
VTTGQVSALAPLRIAVFRALWIASLVSNIGSWMHLVAASWLMTSLTASAALVALLQTASSGPSFLLALPAGALADVLDRRRLVLVTQAWQLVIAGGLGALTAAHLTSPAVLLALTFALGTGAALGLPAFSALTPELVPREQLAGAISLNSVALTAAQTIGPALGGVLVAAVGSGGVFLLNAASFVAVVAVAAAWRRPPKVSGLPAEHVASAIRAGLRYVANAPDLRAVLARAGGYVVCFSALPALLAVITRAGLHASASAYGMLLGCLGAGGVIGGLLLPATRHRLTADKIVVAGTLLYAGILAGLAATTSLAVAGLLLTAAGVAGMANMSSLNIASQSVLPGWVRGRGLALVQLTFTLALAAGAALWGTVAASLGTAAALASAGVCLAATTLLALRYPLPAYGAANEAPASQSEPFVPVTLSPDDGPVQLTTRYQVPAERLAEFLDAAADLARMRRREGALHWGLYSDLASPGFHSEVFIAPSWAEHLRTADRRTQADAAILQRVAALHQGPGKPQLTASLGHDFSRRRHPPSAVAQSPERGVNHAPLPG